MTKNLINKLCGSDIPFPLSAMVELPSGGWDKSGDFRKELEPLLKKVWEVHPLASPGVFFSYYGSDFLEWCNSLETTVTLALPVSALSRERAKTIVDASLSRLTLVLDRIPSGGKDEEDFWSAAEKIISEISEIKNENHTKLPSVRFQIEGTEINIPRLPELVRRAGRMGIGEIIVSSLEDYASHYIAEALILSRESGIRLDLGTRSRTAIIVGEASSLDNQARMALPQTESIFTLSSFRTWLKQLLIREIPPPDFADPSNLQATDERRKACLFPWNWTYITKEGRVRVCPVSQRLMGNLENQPFEEIWPGSEYSNFRKRLLSPYPLEECRKCLLGGWFNPYEITDWLWAGINDQFGIQLGTGWYEMEGGLLYRWSRKEACFRLKNNEKRKLALVLHLPSRKLAQEGEIRINRKKVGDFSLKKAGDSVFHFPLPPSENEDILVEIVCDQELVPNRILQNNDWRRLGVAFKGAYLTI